jgi:hypothetical protein
MCPTENEEDDGSEGLKLGEEEVGVVSLLTPSAIGGCIGTVVTVSGSRFMYKPPLLLAVMSLVM